MEEYRLFLHVAKRKDSDVNSKVSSAIVSVAGWIENDHIKLSCYSAMDSEGILLFDGVDTLKGKVDGLDVQNLISINSNAASLTPVQDKCKLWLSSSTNANSPTPDPKKLYRRIRKANLRHRYFSKGKGMESLGRCHLRRSGEILLKPSQHSAKFSREDQAITDINFSDSQPKAPEVQLATNQNSVEPLTVDNAAQSPWVVSVDQEEFFDVTDTGDDFEMHSCIEFDEPYFVDFPVQQENACDVDSPGPKPYINTTSTLLNSSGIAVIDRLDQLLIEVVPSNSTPIDKCQNIKSDIDLHISESSRKCYQPASMENKSRNAISSHSSGNKSDMTLDLISKLSPRLSDSKQNHQQALMENKSSNTLSTKSSGTKSDMILDLNAASEESQTSSVAPSSIKGKTGQTIPCLLNKKCELHTDLAVEIHMSNTISTSASGNPLKSKEHENSSIEMTSNNFVTAECYQALCPKKFDDLMAKTYPPATSSSHCSSLGTAGNSEKYSTVQCHSMDSSSSSLIKPHDAVGESKSSTPVIYSKKLDSLSKVDKPSVVGQCETLVSRSQNCQSQAIKSDIKGSENGTKSGLSKTSNVIQPNGPEIKQSSESPLKIATSSSGSKEKLQKSKLISHTSHMPHDSSLSNARASNSSNERVTASGKSSVPHASEKKGDVKKIQSKSVEKTSKIADHVAAQTEKCLHIQKLCDCNIETYINVRKAASIPVLKGSSISKAKLRTRDPLGPTGPLVWSRRVRKVYRKLRVRTLLAKPYNM